MNKNKLHIFCISNITNIPLFRYLCNSLSKIAGRIYLTELCIETGNDFLKDFGNLKYTPIHKFKNLSESKKQNLFIKSKRAIRIHDVAKKAGVSVSTVSRVLNGKSDVASETQARILSVIEDLGYAPGTKAHCSDKAGKSCCNSKAKSTKAEDKAPTEVK